MNKKLNNIDVVITKYINNINSSEMSLEDKNKIIQSNNVSNKEALKDKIHEIHNFMRNNGSGYGMNALKVFNLLYGLKKIEENNLLDKINLAECCKFSYLLELANDNKDQELSCLIRGDVLDSINDSSIRQLLLYEIPNTMKGSTFSHLIKEIDKISIIEQTCNVLLSGKIYEYFIGRTHSDLSDLGAYFTDRHIVDYIYNKLNPEINEDGSINSMVDMFGGSGGFTTGYINYLNQKYDNIDWKDNLNNIYHFDMNEDVIKSAGLEFFCLTGVLPNMRDNLKYKNSFTDEFNNKKYKYVITNPPYGGDKIKQSDTQTKRSKIKDYILEELKSLTDELKINLRKKQLKDIENLDKQDKKDSDKNKVSLISSSHRINKFAKKNKLTGNDKEAISLMLMMDTLDIDGTCIGVLKEGVFFNKTYKDIRKCLITNFNVREIISVPQDQFENTSTKTSIIIFDNTEEKITNIKFSELSVERYTEDVFEEIRGEIFLTENKNDISGISDKLISEATIEEVLNNSICSLNGKDYNKKELICGEDYKLVRLGDVCNFLPKSKKTASYGQKEGNFNFYTSSDKIQKCNIADYNENTIIIGTGGNSCIHYANNFSCSADTLLLTSTKINNLYIYYSIKSIWHLLIENMHGSTIKHVTKEMLINFKIPIPKSEEKIKEWTDKISKPFNKKNKNEELIIKLKEEIKNKIIDIEENEDCEEIILEDIIDTQSGEYLTKNNMTNGIYPVYGGGGISNYINKYNYENKIIINKDGVSLDCVKFEFGKFFLNHHGWVLIYKNNDIKNYINYWLFNNQDKIYNLATGSAQKGINKENFLKLKIKIPKNKQLINDLEPLIKKIENLYNNIQEAEILYKQYINELSEEALPNKISKKDNLSEKSLLEISNKNNNLEEPIIKVSKKKISKNNDLEEPIIKVSKKKVSKKDDSNNSSEESLLGLTNKQILKDDDLIKTSKKKVIKKKVIIQNTI